MKNFFGHPFVLSLLIIAVLIFFNSQGWLDVIKDGFYKLTASSQKITYQFSLKINNLISFLKTLNNLNQENVKLKEENQQLLGELAQLKEVARQNEFLCQQLGLEINQTRQLILAQIIGQDSSSLGRYFLINKGRTDGVKKKAAVITAGNLLVGQISRVTDSSSLVRLITDSGSRVNALIQDSTISGLVVGGQELDLVIDLLPQGRIIKEGELVITSGLAGFFPSGLLIGQIEKVISSDVQISQKAKIKPTVDFQTLDKVFVIGE